MCSKGIAHIESEAGHRRAYLDQLSEILNFDQKICRLSRKNFKFFISANRILFTTVGNSFRRYFLICFFRAFLGLPSATVFLGASYYCNNSEWTINRLLLKIWKILPRQSLFAIIPFDVFPSLKKVSNDYIYDPQLWDVWSERKEKMNITTNLSLEVEKEKKGRKIVLYIGQAKKSKCFDEYVKFIENNQDSFYGVSTGRVQLECKESAQKFEQMSMKLVDRFISDDELYSLYAISDLVWCYYSPKYDQSSGVFGHAIQLGVAPIIRQGSVIDRIAAMFNLKVYAITTDDISASSEKFQYSDLISSGLLIKEERQEVFKRIEHESTLKLKKALRLRS